MTDTSLTETSFCRVHHQPEPIPQDCFLICFECKHVFRTDRDLVDEHNGTMAAFAEPGERWTPLTVDEVDDVLSCPVCAHDF